MQEAEVVREKRSIIRCDNYKVDTAVGYPGKKKMSCIRKYRSGDWERIQGQRLESN